MTRVDLEYGAATHVGLVRTDNEDAHLTVPPVFVVADGMGGHDAGDVASSFVVEEFARLADEGLDAASAARTVAAALDAVHTRIDEFDAEQQAAGDPFFSTGTTAVAAVLVADVDAPYWLVANLGDSRAYRFAAGELVQVTVDHSLVQELVDAGTIEADDAPDHPDSHIVTRALGGPVHHEPDLFTVPAEESGRILLCSDGVNGMLAHDDIARILGEHPDPATAADEVVAAAVAAGGRDNATAVVVDVVGLTREEPHVADVQRSATKQETGAHP
ncbi:serine/threonine-protein phosphatase [Nocardioides silvaticus]|uniref:Serine/threonine-protein phosphatase n=1 Tax=Nocardioides silvaticus TaxID=2201891 RepID=A0A316TJK8_9ACTN|nr:protein phosphatase 2C domain-containing protein [Nocardioides silvaticus]PWN04803.1 serine/threonine-protein phosphatase [Nocardioides silvaticus]